MIMKAPLLSFRAFLSVRKALLVAVASIVAGCGGDGRSTTGASAYEPPVAEVQETVVITGVHVDVDTDTLSIRGDKFDVGELAAVEVSLDYSLLVVVTHSANEIVAEVPGVGGLVGSFLLTVRTGSADENMDSWGLVLGDAVLAAPTTQLLIRSVSAKFDEDSQVISLTVGGHNFDFSNWPPTVMFNQRQVQLDAAHCGPDVLKGTLSGSIEELEAVGPDAALITVTAGSLNDHYDAFRLGSDLSSVGATAMSCQRSDRQKVPMGEYCCAIESVQDNSPQQLCWKSGPIREYDTWDGHAIPYFFELTKDYEFSPGKYFADSPPIKLPHRTKSKRENKREVFADLVLLLGSDFHPYNFGNIKWDYIEVKEDNRFLVKKGYRWDGSSRGYEGIFEFATLMVNLRASLIHDVMYDLLRFGYLPYTVGIGMGGDDYRDLADNLYFLVSREDGHLRRSAKPAWNVLRLGGNMRADMHFEDNAPWRFHTLPIANVYTDTANMTIGSDGTKSLNLACVSSNEEIMLDASQSHPIATYPYGGLWYWSLHQTSWEWTLNGHLLAPEGRNLIYQQLSPENLLMTVTPAEMKSKGLVEGSNMLLLEVDRLLGFGQVFHHHDMVKLEIGLDADAPVIAGINEPIIAWPPTHKMRTFTIADFVSDVTDGCSAMSVDDLVIIDATSSDQKSKKCCDEKHKDIVIAADGKSVDLRIERSGCKKKRAYTVYIQAEDEAGNTTTVSYEVHVTAL